MKICSSSLMFKLATEEVNLLLGDSVVLIRNIPSPPSPLAFTEESYISQTFLKKDYCCDKAQ